MTDTRVPGQSSQGSDLPGFWPLGKLLLGATALAVPYVLFSEFSGIFWFDDEGTLLIGFRSMLDGQRMYDDIYSLYGPLYSAVYGLLYVVLHVPLTHVAGRLMAGLMWLAYTAGFAALCHRLTRSVEATLACYMLLLFWLSNLADSPGHRSPRPQVRLRGPWRLNTCFSEPDVPPAGAILLAGHGATGHGA